MTKKTHAPKKQTPRRLHIPDRPVVPPNGMELRAAAEAGVRTLCDKPLRYNVRHNGRVIATYGEKLVSLADARALIQQASAPLRKLAQKIEPKAIKECSACFKLAALSNAQLAEALGRRAFSKGLAREAAKEKRRDARQLELEALDAKIAAAQIDALVCLDHFEQTNTWLRRCAKLVYIQGTAGKYTRCGLAHGHQYDDRTSSGAFCVALDKPTVDTDETVAVAIEAHKRSRNKFDRGDKAYIFKTLKPYCNNCEKDIEPDDLTANGACRNCYCRIPRMHAGMPRPIACRFCDAVLAINCKIGRDYSTSYIETSDPTRRVTVSEHVTLCALRFLGKVERTTHLHLPDQSFVLEHDEEEAAP